MSAVRKLRSAYDELAEIKEAKAAADAKKSVPESSWKRLLKKVADVIVMQKCLALGERDEQIPHWWWQPTGVSTSFEYAWTIDGGCSDERPRAYIDDVWRFAYDAIWFDWADKFGEPAIESGYKRLADFIEQELGGPLMPEEGFKAYFEKLLAAA